METEIKITIPFHDVDSMGIVWHGHYFKYFELARCQLLDRLGFGYKEMAASEYSWPVVDSRIKYIKPIVFDQTVIVEAKLKEYDLRLKIDYLITESATHLRLTKGHTIQVAVSRSNGDLCLPLPDSFREKMIKPKEPKMGSGKTGLQ